MIEQNFEEALPPDWVKANIDDVDNELVILRQVIPWQLILDQLVSFYNPGKGRIGKSLRVMVALLIVSRLRKLSDKQVVGQVKEKFSKMQTFAQRHQLAVWWDCAHLKKRWRAFGRAKAPQRATYLTEFYLMFAPALQTFRACEFGSTVQMTFNRQGFMVTTENFIGQPGDATLYGDTLQCFFKRMNRIPQTIITDLGFRSQDNFSNTPNSVDHLFLGRSDDVIQDRQDFCRRARSATEGFIAVAKNLRGFGRSLYNGRGAAKRLIGDRIWTLLCQTAYNLKKLMQLTKAGQLSCESLLKLDVCI